MGRITLANVFLIVVFGTLLFWPNIDRPTTHDSVSTGYDGVCMITTNGIYASGVLLESGYVLTAAHVVDRNSNGKIDANEKTMAIKFPITGVKEVQAEALAIGELSEKLDVAILKPIEKIKLLGVKLMSDYEYWATKVGTPVYTIGMQNGNYPGNITDGRMTNMSPTSNAHRNSASIYYGNSGGGVFIDKKLAGIAVAVGIGRQNLNVPIFRGRSQIGVATVPYNVPLANSAVHISAPAVRQFLVDKGLEEALHEHPIKCPYDPYFKVMALNAAFLLWLFVMTRFIRYHRTKK